MNRLIKLLNVVIILAMFGCSSDSSDSNNTPISLSGTIKKLTVVGNSPSSLNFNYNTTTGLLENVSDPTNKLEFVYNGTKIIQTKLYENNVLTKTNTISYEGDNLKSILQQNQVEKVEYIYENGFAKTENYMSGSGTNWTIDYSANYTYVAGNITKIVTDILVPNLSTYTLEYDQKNHPYKNMNKYLRYIVGIGSDHMNLYSTNNKIAEYDASSGTPILKYNYVITYNSNNYPTLIKKYVSGNLDSECTIEYN